MVKHRFANFLQKLCLRQLFLLVSTNAILIGATEELNLGICQAYPTCGSSNPNGNVIDLCEPEYPGPFHDLTSDELRKLRTFLENDPNIQAVKSSQATINSSYIYMADLYLPPKSDVLNYLDNNGTQPPRQARVMMFRGDLNPPVVEEYICGPLPNIVSCSLLNLPNRRNPVEFSVRPVNLVEQVAIFENIIPTVEQQIGYILMESYGVTFTNCPDGGCLTGLALPMGSAITGDINSRLGWFAAEYSIPYPTLFPVNFALFLNTTGSDATQWHVEKIWYAGQLYQSYQELITGYDNGSIPVERLTKPEVTDDLFSTLKRRGDPLPVNPQRPPTLVEQDGKRYSVTGKKVEYLGWSFNFRLSPFRGPALYDIRYKGERIVYELALNELAVFYSAVSPAVQVIDLGDSGVLLGSRSKALIPGADCPDSATLVPNSLMAQYIDDPAVYDTAFCLFEQNYGSPLKRHLSYDIPSGSYYGGMLDSALVLRAAMAITNYQYVVDFVFHQDGAIETVLLNTGYIIPSFFSELEQPYGFHLKDKLVGNIHHHHAHFKVDLDIGGTSNRYQTLDLSEEKVPLTTFPDKLHSQVKVTRNLKQTEQEALYKFNFDTPKIHLVNNDNFRNDYGELRSYKIVMGSMSKRLEEEGSGNEPTVAWGRHQLVVTKRKEEEFISSTVYNMADSLNPVVNFTSFYADDESIVDEDLVCWITTGMHHLPSTEDLPIVTTTGQLPGFFLVPFNYFHEDPSMASRDQIYIGLKNPDAPEEGVKVERYGNSRQQCTTPKVTLEEDVAADPDRVLESRRPNPTDF